jgi:hypothetical protein
LSLRPFAAVALALLAVQAAAAPGTIQVQLADGTSILLQSWSFSYEYVSWAKGEPPNVGNAARHEAKELLVGKKAIPLEAQTLEVRYEDASRVVEGEATKVPVARGLVLLGKDRKRSEIKPEPPHVELLLADRSGRTVQARALDLRGETMGGTRREFCLLSYSPLVECPTEADQRVVRIQFDP